MYFKRIETKGLAHFSYVIGDEGQMMIIDPRRDVGVYLEEARKQSMVIKGIFETHRNEDIVSGAKELSEITGAPVYISAFEDLGHTYGTPIKEQSFPFGTFALRSLHTPGHTKGHLSYVLERDGEPYMVFTGDTLFYGDIGRTDFYGENMLKEMTGLLYDSIFEKIFSLGDHVLVYPAHGAGSACGGEIEERQISTVGFERKYNPSLQVKSREEFIEKHGYMRAFPPYFKTVERLNVEGGDYLGEKISPPLLPPLSAASFEGTILDIRSRSAFAGGHVPGSLFLRYDILSSHLGYMEKTDAPLALLADDLCEEQISLAYMTLLRMGYSQVKGYFGLNVQRALEITASEVESLEQVRPSDYKKDSENILVLDVRREDEQSEDDPVERRLSIRLSSLPTSLEEIPKDERILVVCQSGERATVGASYLRKNGFDVGIVRGGMLGLIAQKGQE